LLREESVELVAKEGRIALQAVCDAVLGVVSEGVVCDLDVKRRRA
jgi:hypothetical protein